MSSQLREVEAQERSVGPQGADRADTALQVRNLGVEFGDSPAHKGRTKLIGRYAR